MNYRLVILPKAQAEMAHAVDRYELQQAKLGKRFISCVDKLFNIILKNPFQFSEKTPPFREALVAKFPYLIIYQINDNKIVVYSVFHTSQNSKSWQNI